MSSESVDKINKLLAKVCKKLYKNCFLDFSGSLNYSVSVKIFSSNSTDDFDEIELIEKTLNKNAEVEDIEESNFPELLNVVKECFEFVGDSGSYPNPKYLFSIDFETDLTELLKLLETLNSNDSRVFEFRLKEGHPFYPVYWDYAFLVKNRENNFILIGSSSD